MQAGFFKGEGFYGFLRQLLDILTKSQLLSAGVAFCGKVC